jgi:SAM-dependent methyltransferase
MTSPASTTRASHDRALEQLAGERTVPRLWHENYWFRRHEIAYLTLAPRIAAAAGRPGAVVVEAGSGEGYGVGLLAGAAVPAGRGVSRVVALDYDGAALAHACAVYPEQVAGQAVRSNLVSLPLASGSVDAITSLQVIEHLWTPGEFLAECARVLRPGGLLAVSTPNRLTFSPGLPRGAKPANPYHIREFDVAELTELIGGWLSVTEVLAVRHGPRLIDWQAGFGDPIAAQLALPWQQWPAGLSELVRSVGASDFVLTPIDDDATNGETPAPVLDLVVLARS